MPPRHHYWTIILEGKPTAFRAHTQEELIPTLRQLQARHPDAVLKWFARGRLWASQEEERAAMIARRRPKTSVQGDRRPRDWRPGGEHKDPRDRFKVPRDEKRRRFAQKLRRDRVEGPPTSDRPRLGRSRPFDKKEGTDRSSRFSTSRPDRGAKPPWKRDDRREGDGQTPPHPQGKFRRRSSSRPPGARKPGGGGNRGGGGQR
jgi:hypothetical protein